MRGMERSVRGGAGATAGTVIGEAGGWSQGQRPGVKGRLRRTRAGGRALARLLAYRAHRRDSGRTRENVFILGITGETNQPVFDILTCSHMFKVINALVLLHLSNYVFCHSLK